MGRTSKRRMHPFAATTYVGRILVGAVSSLMVASVVWHSDPRFAVGVLAFGLAYPHVMYQAAAHGDSRKIGLITFYVDTFILGVWVVLLGYALIPGLAIIVVVFSTALLMGGLRLAFLALIPFIVATSVGLLLVEPDFYAHDSGIPFYLATFLILVYVVYITWLTNRFGYDLITARKNLEAQNEKILSQAEQLEHAQQEAIAANEAKSQFLANMSHELRTPMNAIIGYTEMLSEDAEDAGLTHFVEDLGKVRSASRHLLELINSVLDLSKIEAGKMDLLLEPVRIAQFVEELATTMQPLLKSNGNELAVDVTAAPDEVDADITKLRQAALNLLSNANKFTKGGRIEFIARRLRQEGRVWLDLAVTDTGIGMDDAQLERVFQPFVQADAATTRNYGGTGLGLPISKGFCELMGGTIVAESTPGVGSTFTIRIPIK